MASIEKAVNDSSQTLPVQLDSDVRETQKDTPFSIFVNREKKWISFVASFGAMFSTLSSYIYMPAVVPIATDLGVSIALVYLTVTSYLVVAGIAPAFMGDIADQAGRSYGAAYGVLSDITTVAERGSYVGSLILFTNAAPSFGPVIAGVFAERLSWRWIFWFLVILTGTYWVVVLLLLPETQRKVVGNGSIPTQGIYKSLFDFVTRDRKSELNEGQLQGTANKRKHHIPNPFKCIPLLFSKGNFSVIMVGSITYTVKMTLQTSLAAQCIEVYGLNYLQAGLIYLPSGVGGALASYTTGKFLDRNIKKLSSMHGTYRRGEDISDFPIEQARFAGIYTLIVISAIGTAAYGVSLMKRTHIHGKPPPNVMKESGLTTIKLCGTLLTDLNPHASATVQASYNLVRCLGAGVGIAVQQPLTDAAGLGWCFGVFSVVMLLATPLAMALRRCGLGWRRERTSKRSLAV
ncbi:MFS general substrate transporter [Coniochaeta ligniaria NRRL 30616]|uniref:MFS general substrate transporter n=1 Tax=Coniochaeta ligniaria NRRL 30616 TaxID=1408157 RepID=A0A1J7IF83_9PEZI|nr:MFS general substrate transporter [Coniochaeta ligniaria NRRL 30616]